MVSMWLIPSKIVSVVRYTEIKELVNSEERGINGWVTGTSR
jgi:hypothetical protein